MGMSWQFAWFFVVQGSLDQGGIKNIAKGTTDPRVEFSLLM